MIARLIVFHQKKILSKYIRAYVEERNLNPLNIIEIDPEDKILTIEDIRFFQKTLSVNIPHERLFIIYSFELASIIIQNALLKSLEEKSERNSVFIATTNPESSLPTIRSRMQIVFIENDRAERLSSEEEKEYGVLYGQIMNGYRFMGNSLLPTAKDEAISFLDKLTQYLDDKMKDEPTIKLANSIKAILRTKDQIIYTNVIPQLALDNLLIFIHKTVSMK